MENLGNLMIDIESFGNKSKGALVSIGAVEFDMKTGEIGKVFYEKCSLQSSIDAGLNVNGDTINWWMNQSDEARKEVTSGNQSLSKLLWKFTEFVQSLKPSDLEVWGNSNRFDMGLLEDAYESINKKIPWKYVNERDVRTLVSFNPEIKKNTKFEGTKHNPVDDCYFQIKYCVEIYKSIMN